SDIGIVVSPSQVVRLQEGIERGVDIFSGGSGGHGVGPLLVCAFDRSFPICYYYSRMGRGCQALWPVGQAWLPPSFSVSDIGAVQDVVPFAMRVDNHDRGVL